MGRTFRICCRPGDEGLVENLMRAEGFAPEPDPYFSLARAVRDEPIPLGRSLAARFGLLYVQDRSSMLPPACLDPEPGARVLDVCASPGGKTGLAAGMVGAGGFVLGLEPNPSRLSTLRRNLERNGLMNTATMGLRGESDATPWERFPRALLDPPCSGWGTEEKNPKVRELWRGKKIEPLIRLQRALLDRAAERLPAGARFVYSTCTTNPAENEEQTSRILGRSDLRLIPLPHPSGFELNEPCLPEAQGALCVRSGEGGQGFYVALFEKPGAADFSAPDIEELDLPGGPLDAEALNPETMRMEGLPPGRLYDFGGQVHFVAAGAGALYGLRGWRGPLAGKLRGEAFSPSPHCRALLPAEPGPGSLEADSPETLRALLSGASLPAPPGQGPAPLYFQGLGLGWLTRKGKRVVWSGG